MSKKIMREVISQLDSLERTELQEVEHSIKVKLIEKEAAALEDVKAQMEQLCRSAGISTDSLLASLPRRGRGAPGGKVPVKYRNPDNPSLTWTGRGRQPDWLVTFIENGGTREMCEIAPSPEANESLSAAE